MAIEIASAILIVAGVFRIVAILYALSAPAGTIQIEPTIVVAETLLQVLTIAIGVLARTGRGWIAVVNVVAVLAFIELLNLPSVVSLAFGVLFGFAFAALYLNKPWFDAMRAWRGRAPEVRA
jgi:hypothetical protein